MNRAIPFVALTLFASTVADAAAQDTEACAEVVAAARLATIAVDAERRTYADAVKAHADAVDAERRTYADAVKAHADAVDAERRAYADAVKAYADAMKAHADAVSAFAAAAEAYAATATADAEIIGDPSAVIYGLIVSVFDDDVATVLGEAAVDAVPALVNAEAAAEAAAAEAAAEAFIAYANAFAGFVATRLEVLDAAALATGGTYSSAIEAASIANESAKARNAYDEVAATRNPIQIRLRRSAYAYVAAADALHRRVVTAAEAGIGARAVESAEDEARNAIEDRDHCRR